MRRCHLLRPYFFCGAGLSDQDIASTSAKRNAALLSAFAGSDELLRDLTDGIAILSLGGGLYAAFLTYRWINRKTAHAPNAASTAKYHHPPW